MSEEEKTEVEKMSFEEKVEYYGIDIELPYKGVWRKVKIPPEYVRDLDEIINEYDRLDCTLWHFNYYALSDEGQKNLICWLEDEGLI
jgi:hypothetical protein